VQSLLKKAEKAKKMKRELRKLHEAHLAAQKYILKLQKTVRSTCNFPPPTSSRAAQFEVNL